MKTNDSRHAKFRATDRSQQIALGTPIAFRMICRQWVSHMVASALWRFRGPAPEHAIRVLTASAEKDRLVDQEGATRTFKVKAWTPCGGPVLGAGGEPKETIFTNLYLQIASL